MAHLQDPQGALFAVSSQEHRSSYTDPQIGDFSWHELLTSNYQTAFDFYSKLFGWEKMLAMELGPQGIYQIFGTGGHQLGGMFTPGPGAMPPGGPQWLPYIFVRDARKTAEVTKGLGALIAHEPTEVPGGDMVFTGVDRQGAMFAAQSKKREAPAPASTKRAKATKIATKVTKVTKTSKTSTIAKKAVKKAAPTKKAARKPSRRR